MLRIQVIKVVNVIQVQMKNSIAQTSGVNSEKPS